MNIRLSIWGTVLSATAAFWYTRNDFWPHAGFAKSLDDAIETIEDPQDRKFLERTAPQMKLGPDLVPLKDIESYSRIFHLGGGGGLNSRWWIEDR